MIRSAPLPLLALIAGLACAAPVRAQINPFHTSSSGGLSRADVDAINEAAGRLNSDPAPAVGKAVLWKSTTGLGGSMTLDAIRQIRGMQCHRLVTSFDPSRAHKASNWALTWCRTPSGEWRILN